MVSQPANPASVQPAAQTAAPGDRAQGDRAHGSHSPGSHAAPTPEALTSFQLHAQLQAAFAANIPLPDIITTFRPSLEDLHAFLSSPDIPDRLQALRALTNFSEELQSSAARLEGLAYLRTFLKDAHDPIEKRRAATALLRAGAHKPSPKNPEAGARPDIADWSTEVDRDDAGDADLDDADEPPSERADDPRQRDVRGPAATSPPQPALANPPLTAAPAEIVAHQLARLQNLQTGDPSVRPTVKQAIDALDRTLSIPMRMHDDTMDAFEAAFPPAALNLRDAQLIQDQPEFSSDSNPRSATIRVHVRHADGSRSQLLFLLHHEPSRFPNCPHNWATRRITRADSS